MGLQFVHSYMIVLTRQRQLENSCFNRFLRVLLDKLITCNKYLDQADKMNVKRLFSFHKLELKSNECYRCRGKSSINGRKM